MKLARLTPLRVLTLLGFFSGTTAVVGVIQFQNHSYDVRYNRPFTDAWQDPAVLTGAAVFGGVCAMIALVTWHLMRMNRKQSGKRGLVHASLATIVAAVTYYMLFMIPALPGTDGTVYVDLEALERRFIFALVAAPLLLSPIVLPIGWSFGRWAQRRQLATQARVF